MSFYDEFLKSLEEDNEELETAIEGLETDEVPADEDNETEESSEENTEAVEAYLEKAEILSELMLEDIAPIAGRFIEGEIGEESFAAEIDAVLEGYCDASSTLEIAEEGVRKMVSKKARLVDTMLNTKDVTVIENQHRTIIANYDAYHTRKDEVDKFYHRNHVKQVEEEMKASAAAYAESTKFNPDPKKLNEEQYKVAFREKLKGFGYDLRAGSIGILVGTRAYNTNAYEKLAAEVKKYADMPTSEFVAKCQTNNGFLQKALTKSNELAEIAKRAVGWKSAFSKARTAIQQTRQKIHNAKANFKVDLVVSKSEARKKRAAHNAEARAHAAKAGQAFKEFAKETGSAVGSKAKSLDPTIRPKEFIKQRKITKAESKLRGATASFAIQGLESYEKLQEVNPICAAALEGYLNDIFEMDEFICSAYESFVECYSEEDSIYAAIENYNSLYAEGEDDTEEEESTETPAEEVPEETPAEEEEETPEAPAEEAMVEVSDEDMLTSGMESILFLEALRAGCTSEEEYKNILSENATELQLYGVVDPVAIARESYEDEEDEDMEVATEAKNIVRLNREAKISTEVARMSIGLAKKAKDPLYKSYHKYSVLKRQFRDKIYAKYNSRAIPLARKAVANGRNRAAMINSPAGNGIVARIDTRLKQLDKSARNMQAIKKDLAPSKPSMGKEKK